MMRPGLLQPKPHSQAERVSVPAMEVIQGGTRCILTRLTLPQLARYAITDFYSSAFSDTDEQQGYQRPLSEGRAKQIEHYMVEEYKVSGSVRMPGTILCSARDQQLEVVDGMVELHSFHKFYIVDGQHRAAAYGLALKNRSIDDVENFQVPVTIITQINKNDEMRLFNVINSTQKSVDGSLTARILAMVDANGGKLNDKEETKAVLATVVSRLNEDPASPFKRRIAMPDRIKIAVGSITKAKTLQDSLRPIDAMLFNTKLDHDISIVERATSVYRIVFSIWEALRSIDTLFDAFDAPEQYALMQAGGVSIIHLLSYQLMRQFISPTDRANTAMWKDLFSRSESLRDEAFWAKGNSDMHVRRGRGADAVGTGGFIAIVRLILKEMNPDEYFNSPKPVPEETVPFMNVVPADENEPAFSINVGSSEDVVIPSDIMGTAGMEDGGDSQGVGAVMAPTPPDSPMEDELPPPEIQEEAVLEEVEDPIHIHPAVHDATDTGNVLVLQEKPKQAVRPKKRR